MAVNRAGQNLSELFLRNAYRDEEHNRIMLRQLEEQTAKGELSPVQAETIAAQRRLKVQPGYFEKLQPSVTTRLQGALVPFLDAKDASDVPGPTMTREIFKATRIPYTGELEQAPVSAPGGGELPSRAIRPTSTEFNTVLQARQEKMRSFEPKKIGAGMNAEGAPTEIMGQWNPDVGRHVPTDTLTMGPTSAQAGRAEGEKGFASYMANEGSPARVGREIAIANQTEADTRAGKVQTSAQMAGAAEAARQKAALKFAPEREAAAQRALFADLKTRGDFEAQEKGKEAANAVARVMPIYNELIDVTARINTLGPYAAPVYGTIQKGLNLMGASSDVRDLNQLTAQILRPAAVAAGIREANVTDQDMEVIKQAIGIDVNLTAEQRVTAMRRLGDLLSLGPVVAARLPREASMQDRMDAVKGFGMARRQAEQEAIKAGKLYFTDPATGAQWKVVQ